MNVSEFVTETFDRLPDLVRSAVEDLTPQQLRWSPARTANSVGWLVWHLTRVQDYFVAALLDQEQIWAQGDWARRFDLEADPTNTGFGHTAKQAAAVRPESYQTLIDYYDAVAPQTRNLLRDVTPKGLDRIVDEKWDPPVSLGSRLVSIANDDLQHVGQAAYVRGLLSR